ncbi:uncharacterized protein LOC107882543 isoform X2 [Acyrthosiphon pisum]|uniref:Uncharacterized protein n=1 Tax=Acyrthosiphon pisum TaxID=7029 RepID=A0A8R2NNC2_ACYPI|nr:uncharacterized protein LOC107882543 isoform X2 [Acyrthosiphon pisum]
MPRPQNNKEESVDTSRRTWGFVVDVHDGEAAAESACKVEDRHTDSRTPATRNVDADGITPHVL